MMIPDFSDKLTRYQFYAAFILLGSISFGYLTRLDTNSPQTQNLCYLLSFLFFPAVSAMAFCVSEGIFSDLEKQAAKNNPTLVNRRQ